MNYQTSKRKKDVQQGGFAMLFTVLLISIVLSIALGLSNVTFKQTILSSLAKDSQIAFYQADAGTECGLYYDFTRNVFPEGTTVLSLETPNAVEETFTSIECGEQVLNLDYINSETDHIVYVSEPSDQPCFSITFDKTDDTVSMIESRGYNICRDHPRQVERALRVRYQ